MLRLRLLAQAHAHHHHIVPGYLLFEKIQILGPEVISRQRGHDEVRGESGYSTCGIFGRGYGNYVRSRSQSGQGGEGRRSGVGSAANNQYPTGVALMAL